MMLVFELSRLTDFKVRQIGLLEYPQSHVHPYLTSHYRLPILPCCAVRPLRCQVRSLGRRPHSTVFIGGACRICFRQGTLHDREE